MDAPNVGRLLHCRRIHEPILRPDVSRDRHPARNHLPTLSPAAVVQNRTPGDATAWTTHTASPAVGTSSLDYATIDDAVGDWNACCFARSWNKTSSSTRLSLSKHPIVNFLLDPAHG